MRIWIKNFGYYKNKGYQFFESEICIDKEAMRIEEDFKTSTEFVGLSEINELQKELETTRNLLKESFMFIDFIIDCHDTLGQAKKWKEKALAKLSKEVVG